MENLRIWVVEYNSRPTRNRSVSGYSTGYVLIFENLEGAIHDHGALGVLSTCKRTTTLTTAVTKSDYGRPGVQMTHRSVAIWEMTTSVGGYL